MVPTKQRYIVKSAAVATAYHRFAGLVSILSSAVQFAAGPPDVAALIVSTLQKKTDYCAYCFLLFTIRMQIDVNSS